MAIIGIVAIVVGILAIGLKLELLCSFKKYVPSKNKKRFNNNIMKKKIKYF